MKTTSSQSAAVMENLADVAQTLQPNNQGLRAHVHRLSILGGALLVVSAIATIMLMLQSKGVTIESFPKDSKTEEQIKRLLDYYNSITDSLSLFVIKPVDLFLGLVMAAAFLCLVTSFTLDRQCRPLAVSTSDDGGNTGVSLQQRTQLDQYLSHAGFSHAIDRSRRP